MAQPMFSRKERRSPAWLALPLIAALALAGVLVLLNQRADGRDPFRLRLEQTHLGQTTGSFTRAWSRAAQGAEVPADGARATELTFTYDPGEGVGYLRAVVLTRDGSSLTLSRGSHEEDLEIAGQRRSGGGESLESLPADAPGTPLDPALLALDWVGLAQMEPLARRTDLEGPYDIAVRGPEGGGVIRWAETAYLWHQGEFVRLDPRDERRELSAEMVHIRFAGARDPDSDRRYVTHFLIPVRSLSATP